MTTATLPRIPDQLCPEAPVQPSLLDSALEWAECGFPVLPLHSAGSQGRCSCLKRCDHAGKHPRLTAGTDFAAATTNEGLIREWWEAWPDANLGVPTGQRTNLFVVDLDTKGDQWRQVEFLTQYGVDGAAVIVKTGSGGRHYWFRGPEVRGRLAHAGSGLPFGVDGIHLRCDGGLVVVPPSRNAARPYRLLEADFEELAPPPADLVALLLTGRKDTTEAGTATVFREGERNTTLASLAGTMRCRGMEAVEIAPGLLEVNRRPCVPPLPEDEVHQIAVSISRYEAERPAGASVEVPTMLLADSSLGVWAKVVYAVLAQHADWKGPRAGDVRRCGVPYRLAHLRQCRRPRMALRGCEGPLRRNPALPRPKCSVEKFRCDA